VRSFAVLLRLVQETRRATCWGAGTTSPVAVPAAPRSLATASRSAGATSPDVPKPHLARARCTRRPSLRPDAPFSSVPGGQRSGESRFVCRFGRRPGCRRRTKRMQRSRSRAAVLLRAGGLARAHWVIQRSNSQALPLRRCRGQMPCLPGDRIPLGSSASLIVSLKRRYAWWLNEYWSLARSMKSR